MRESIGGTMLFWIVLFFLSIFITFLAFVIKYAHVYKVKNSLINYIERAEGVETIKEVRERLTALGYPKDHSFFICQNTVTRSGKTYGIYYTVELYTVFDIPLAPSNVMAIGIKGETRMITSGVVKTLDSKKINIPDCKES
jgi:hypothetical protein